MALREGFALTAARQTLCVAHLHCITREFPTKRGVEQYALNDVLFVPLFWQRHGNYAAITEKGIDDGVIP
ncbi:Uncharacterised protein [Vibrio cholerae]|nr:Uncharacterised protein [Vibrio cholerae]